MRLFSNLYIDKATLKNKTPTIADEGVCFTIQLFEVCLKFFSSYKQWPCEIHHLQHIGRSLLFQCDFRYLKQQA